MLGLEQYPFSPQSLPLTQGLPSLHSGVGSSTSMVNVIFLVFLHGHGSVTHMQNALSQLVDSLNNKEAKNRVTKIKQ